ncbi:MAG: PilZ domain-containing protein, partial [Phycisphaerales bacterium]
MFSPVVAETTGLLTLARKQGERDVYAGKRSWVRYQLGMRIEVSTDPLDAGQTWSAIMHNVSGGGIGFWSKRDLEDDSVVHIRDYSEQGPPVWLVGRVTHRTVGLRGYLIGLAFDDPAPRDAHLPPESDIVTDGSERSMSADGDGKPIRSLQQKCAGSTALACT